MSEQKIELYDGPAGGWGALRSVAHHLREQGVAAKGARTLLAANQPDGFDCPGCAWPDREHTSTFEFCENGAKSVAAEATSRRATPEVLAERTVTEWAEQSDHALEALGRLTEPVVYDALTDRYRRIGWDDAFATIGQALRALPDPNQAAFYTSGRTSNEAAFLYQLFVREYGTNNFPDCSNLCHEPSGAALKATIGVGKGTVTLDDFEQADLILVFGQNPGTNHPRMLGELRAAARRGARIVSINPLRERGLERFADPQDAVEMATMGSTPISSHFVQLRIGGDFAFAKGVCKRLLELDEDARLHGLPPLIDVDFIAAHTHGFERFLQDTLDEDWAVLEAESGIGQPQFDVIARLYARSERTIACWGMGLTQHQHAVATIEVIVALLLLRGNLGRPGAGVCPVRGHSNVQGDRTMGIDEKPSAALLDRLAAVFGIEPPRAPGWDVVATIEAMRDGHCKLLFAMGGNFAAAAPDATATFAALRQCEMTVHVATKFNRSHVVHGRQALLLPCLGRTEVDLQAGVAQAVTVEDSMSMVHLSRGRNAPASPHLLSEPTIVARLAEAALPDSRIPWRRLGADHALIRDRIADVFDAFENFNERVAHPGGFRLPNGAAERRWATPSARAEFHAHPVPTDTHVHRARRDTRHRDTVVFTMATVRSHDQYNTTVHGLDDRYRGVYGHRRVVFIHAEDLQAIGLRGGDWVDITSLYGDGVERRADRFLLVPYDIPRGSIASYYPETNGLVPLTSFAVGARTPTSKSIPVKLTPHAA